MSETWDWLNVVEEKLLTTLQGDAELGSGGSLEIKTWEAEARDDAAQYQDRELPAGSVDVAMLGPGPDAPLGADQKVFRAVVLFVTEAGAKDRRKASAKQLVARTCRLMDLQILPANQLSGLPAALAGGVGGSVYCEVESAIVDQGNVGNFLRAVAAIQIAIRVQILLPG